MRIKTQITLFLLYFITTANECKKTGPPKTDNGLPFPTQTGANIFACRVNGKNWIAETSIFHIRGGVSDDTLAVSADISDNGFELISLIVKGNAIQGGMYSFSDTIKALAEFRTNKLCGIQTGAVYRYFSTTGEIGITKLDITNKILSGTFSFIAPRINCSDSLKITDGRFDIKYY
jgi:hypothetical protein